MGEILRRFWFGLGILYVKDFAADVYDEDEDGDDNDDDEDENGCGSDCLTGFSVCQRYRRTILDGFRFSEV